MSSAIFSRRNLISSVSKSCHLARVLSLESPNVLAKPESRCRTLEDNPVNQNLEHECRFYVIPPTVYNQLYKFGGIPKSYEVQANTFGETALMVRKPALDLMNCIKHADYSRPVIRYVLYGEPGSGKSLTLAHLLHFGFNTDHLIVHIPWVPDWMKKCREHCRSETKEGFRDTPFDSAAWLAHFKTQNLHLLTKIELPVSQKYVWSKREETLPGAPLVELVDLGINRIKYASSIIVAIASEIKTLSTEGRCKTLVAIDGYNSFFNERTMIKDEDWKIVPPSRLTITEAFIKLTNHDWSNGSVVLTVDKLIWREPERQESDLPLYQLGKEGFNHLDPFVPIYVPGYNEKEFHSCIDYYMDRCWIQNEKGNSDDGRNELLYLSAGNPFQLMKICASL